jgi:uncharacterized protein YraI
MLTFLGGVETANGYTWYEVESPSHEGWIASSYVSEVLPTITATATRTRTPAASATPSATTTRTADDEIRIGDSIQTTAGMLNLRSGFGTNSSIIRTIPFGTTGTVLEGPRNATGYAWFRIQTPLGAGWVAGDYITLQTVGVAAFIEDAPSLTITETPTVTPVVPTATEELAPVDPTATDEPVVPDPTQTPIPEATETVGTAPDSTATSVPDSPTATVELPEPSPTATALPDSDGDGLIDHFDRCPDVADTGNDTDGDLLDDACDPTPLGEPTSTPTLVPTVPPTIPPTAPAVVPYEVSASAGADTSVSSVDPSAVQPADQTGGLPVGGAEGGVAYITFWVEGIGAGEVSSALLYLPVVSGGGTVTVSVIPGGVIDEWSLTYGSAPGGSAAITTSVSGGSEIPIDLTGWIAADGPITIAVSGAADPAIILGSKEGGWPARLVITALG